MHEQLALFPLNSFLLPRGRLKLRLFEPRYIRLMKEALSHKRDFAMATLNPFVNQSHPDRILSQVCQAQIEDFEVLPDGLLGMTIRGIGRYQIEERWQETDKLHVAQVSPVPDWHSNTLSNDLQPLASAFVKLLTTYPQLAELYPKPELKDAAWLAGRWLELLPMQPALKISMAATEPDVCLQQLQHWLDHNA